MFEGSRQLSAASQNPHEIYFNAGWLKLRVFLDGNLLDQRQIMSARTGDPGEVQFYRFDLEGQHIMENTRLPATYTETGDVQIKSATSGPCSGCVQNRRKSREWWHL